MTIEWNSLLTNPLGLAAFTLAIVFGVIAKTSTANLKMKYIALGLAVVAVLGGLTLSLLSQSSNGEISGKTEQKSSGAASPNLYNIQGGVTFNYGETAEKKK